MSRERELSRQLNFKKHFDHVRPQKDSESKDAKPLDSDHHREIISVFYNSNPSLPLPQRVIEFVSWSEVKNNPELEADTLVFVDGGITKYPIDLGSAVLVNDGGIVEHSIKCGRFHRDGGIALKEVKVDQSLLIPQKK